MRKKLGTFRYAVELASADGDRFETVQPVVDTGALYSQFPASQLEGLGYYPDASRRCRLADGRVIESPIGDVRVRIGSETRTVTCVFIEEGSDSLLGAMTLEAFSMVADPVNETLTPIIALRL